jgi:hypothetical protein
MNADVERENREAVIEMCVSSGTICLGTREIDRGYAVGDR